MSTALFGAVFALYRLKPAALTGRRHYGAGVADNQPLSRMGADLQAKKINYGNNPMLKWCLTNTGIQTDRNGNIVPVKNQAAKQRIDGAASLLDAYVGLCDHYNEFLSAL